MPKVKYIASPTTADQRYVLVKYGEEYGQNTAKGIAKKEGISEVFACK